MDRLSKIRPMKTKMPISSSAGGNTGHGDTRTSYDSSNDQYLQLKTLTTEPDRVTSRSIEKTKLNTKISVKIEDTLRTDCTPDPNVVLSNLVFLLQDETGRSQKKRIQGLLEAYVRATTAGFCIRDLGAIVFILDHLVEHQAEYSFMLTALLENAYRPVLLMTNSDVDKYFDQLVEYFNFLGYTLMRLEDDSNFELAHSVVYNQLQSVDSVANSCVTPLRVRRAAAAHTTFITTAARMLALCSRERLQKFVELGLLLAFISPEICMAMINENILENILYRFNPYFPDQELPEYEINPKNPHDDDLKLGDSSIHLMPVLSLLLILLHTLRQYLDREPSLKKDLRCPDSYALRSWIWAFRLECRARERRHERSTMLVVTMAMTDCFGEQLQLFSTHLVPDILSLAVQTEIPTSSGWVTGVYFNTTQSDAQFKKLLIYCSVLFLKTFPHNIHIVESQNWMVGLMYLVDPCLYRLRCRWYEPLFSELRNAALQALVTIVPLCPHIAQECGLIRRTLWYIEWFTVSAFDTSLLYWNLRLMHAAVGTQDTSMHKAALQDMSESHAVIVIVKLCYTLLSQKNPPVERKQAVLALCLQLLTSSVKIQRDVCCAVYPHIQWPESVNTIAKIMLNCILQALTKNLIIYSRWTISLFNFIWECVMWNKKYRSYFVSDNGIYKILDVISMSGEWLQCIGLALVCEVARAGEAVGQLVTWRARPSAVVVERGASLPTLLAAIARDECRTSGVQLSQESGVIENMEYPLLGDNERAQLEGLRNSEPSASATPSGLMSDAAAGLSGSRLSKVYALLQMLSDDLHNKVVISDETYKIYKNVPLSAEDEVMLTLCAHWQVCKMGHVWGEVHALVYAGGVPLLPEDEQLLDEFLLLYKGWAQEIKYQQEQVLEKLKNTERKEEASLYALLSRCRLTSALDALRDLQQCVRSSHPTYRAHESLREAVAAHHRRCDISLPDAKIIRTFLPPVDDTNVIGQQVKVYSIPQEYEKQCAKTADYSCGC